MKKHIVVIAEHYNGDVDPVTCELVAFARELGSRDQDHMIAVVMGNNVDEIARRIAEQANIDTLGLNAPNAVACCSEITLDLLESEMRAQNPDYICVAQTSQGMDFAPALAVRLQCACISGIHDIHKDQHGIAFLRAAYNGKFNLKLRIDTGMALLTIAPGAFPYSKPERAHPAKVEIREYGNKPSRIQHRETVSRDNQDSRLDQARAIVAAGRGIKDKENLALIEKIAALFPGGTVAGSRPVIDMGWLDHNRQVGLTGHTVSPDLYMACGISGASQHIVGMRGSGFVVSINADPHAAIFNHSDVCIIDDVVPFLQTLLKAAG